MNDNDDNVKKETITLKRRENYYMSDIIFKGHKLEVSLVNTEGDFYIKLDGINIIFYDNEQNRFGSLNNKIIEPIEEIMKKYKFPGWVCKNCGSTSIGQRKGD